MPEGRKHAVNDLGLTARGCPPSVVNGTILDMINFCPPGTPITARRALKNVLQTRHVYQTSGRPFFYSPRCDRALPRYLQRPPATSWPPSRPCGPGR
jgi:hypothetical protein